MGVWKYTSSPKTPGRYNMQQDIEAFDRFENGHNSPHLRIYSWMPKCITAGYSQKLEEIIDIDRAQDLGWDAVKRPTGGGIVFHNGSEIAYSLVIAIDDPILPKGLIASYKKISEAIISGLNNIGIKAELLNTFDRSVRSDLCFSYPAEYEVAAGGRKLVGSAQKRGKKALLQQGSVFVRSTPESAFSVLRKSYCKLNAVSVEEILGREVGFEELSEELKKGFETILGVSFCEV